MRSTTLDFSGEAAADAARDDPGVATADAALEDAGVPFGGVAITLRSISPLQIAMRSSHSSLCSALNQLGTACLVSGGLLGNRVV